MIVNRVFGGGTSVNGTVVNRTVKDGYSVSSGDFVQFDGTGYVIPYIDTIGGVAKTSGGGGATIEVYVP